MPRGRRRRRAIAGYGIGSSPDGVGEGGEPAEKGVSPGKNAPLYQPEKVTRGWSFFATRAFRLG
jgi:hypothetical protein